MNLHQRRLAGSILGLLTIAFSGCSSTMGSRFGGTPPQAKAIAVVGDRPVSVASGDPGDQVVADRDPLPDPKPNPKARISGRVVDDQGSPIANATVRLADGATKGGKDIRATTDGSGGFTLNGLRAGSTYALIAEDEEGTMSGRVTAKTSTTGVEISLLSDEAAAKAASRRNPRPARARSISDRGESPETSPDRDVEPAVNREDVSSVTDPAEPLDPGPISEFGRPQLIPPQPTTGWQNTKAVKKSKPRTEDTEALATSADDAPRRPRTSNTASTTEEDEDGPNPLPPAIEPGNEDEPVPKRTTRTRPKPAVKVPARQPESSGEMTLAPEASAVERPDSQRSPATLTTETLVASTDLPPVGASGGLAESVPSPLAALPESVLPSTASTSGSSEMPPPGQGLRPTTLAASPPGPPTVSTSATQELAPTSPASQPVFSSQGVAPVTGKSTPPAPADYNPFALVAANPTSPVVEPVVAGVGLGEAAQANLVAPEDSDLVAKVPPGPKMKWGDLAAQDSRAKPLVEPTRATVAASFVKRFRPTPVEVKKVDASLAQCSYDTKLRKLKDFRLPDLEGKPVRFQELDADYVLLDFWGTWCSPCLESIPHLVELQKKYGPTRLKVVGIACEEAPVEQRKAKVEELSRRLGINYPVLLSTMDGKPCPVQQSFAIQAMPTMILLDRKGQILWRSTGSTPANESRLDRILSSQMSWSDTARR